MMNMYYCNVVVLYVYKYVGLCSCNYIKYFKSQQGSYAYVYYVGDFIMKDTHVDEHLEMLGYSSETVSKL